MNTPPENSQALPRTSFYKILIGVSVGLMLGRVLAVESVDKIGLEKDRIAHIDRDIKLAKASLVKKGLEGDALEKALKAKEEQIRRDANLRRPFLCANDRSRWCTIRALVEPEMRVEGSPYAIEKVIQEPNWDTIDMVKHDGRLFSSKPPLTPTLIAGIYWIIFHLTGMSLGTHPFVVGRIILILVNVIPLGLSLVLLGRLVERFGTTDWGRLFVMTAAAFGTFLTTFSVTLNNHVTAAVCCIVFIYLAVRIWFDGERRLRYFFAAGLAGAFMAANELPSLALCAGVSLALLWKSPGRTLGAYLPAAVWVLIPFCATNWLAYGTLEIPYSHRTAGDGWYNYTYERNGKTYDSYWKNPKGVDRGEPSRAIYAANVLVGHHGIFSLTPIWILSVFGTLYWLRYGQPGTTLGTMPTSGAMPTLAMGMPESPKSPQHAHDKRGHGTRHDTEHQELNRKLRELALLIGGISVVCIAYFLKQPLENRNYGGVASGFRWVFWLAPLWLLVLLPAADVFSRKKWLRGLALTLLVASALSVAYPTWNPWTPPWIVDFMQYIK